MKNLYNKNTIDVEVINTDDSYDTDKAELAYCTREMTRLNRIIDKMAHSHNDQISVLRNSIDKLKNDRINELRNDRLNELRNTPWYKKIFN